MAVDKVFYAIKILVIDKPGTAVNVEIDTGKQYAHGLVGPDNTKFNGFNGSLEQNNCSCADRIRKDSF